MSDIAIRVDSVSKAYLIGLEEMTHETLGGTIFSWIKSPSRNYNTLKRLNTFRHNKDSEDLFWALKNVSFELKHGDTLGIIGKNGAGKSTILKILSRITNPTKGTAEVFGRVASLLEVGTGFNNELTGRENIYLNGTILGMKRREIDKKFDAIVDFSGIEKFIDTQVKKYSSGMRIRLAFSVAANIETDVMIIDEVLSIGDAEFQKKSLAKMTQKAKEGTAVILVTHNMMPIQNLCRQAIFLQNGEVVKHGNSSEVISLYLGDLNQDKTKQMWEFERAPGSEYIKLIKAEVNPTRDLQVIRAGDGFSFDFVFYNLIDDEFNVNIIFHLIDEYDNLIFVGSSTLTNYQYRISKGYFRAHCEVPENLLNEGKFVVSKLFVVRGNDEVLFDHSQLLTFEVTSAAAYEHGKNGRIDGLLKPRLEWDVHTEKEAEALT